MSHKKRRNLSTLFAGVIIGFMAIWAGSPVVPEQIFERVEYPVFVMTLVPAETTYFSDHRFVYLTPTIDTMIMELNTSGTIVDSFAATIPNLDSIPQATLGELLIGPINQGLFITHDWTVPQVDVLDSLQVDSVYSNWALTDTPAYLIPIKGFPQDTPGVPPQPPGNVTPDPVTNLLVTADTGNTRLVITWTETVDSYQVVSGLNAGGEEDTMEVAAPPAHRTVTVDGTYYGCTRAFDGDSISDARCNQVVYNSTPPDPPPPPPGGLTDTTNAVYVYSYEGYANSTDYRNDTGFWNAPTGNVALTRQFITTDVPYPGLTKSVRYDWVYDETCEFGNGPAFTGCDSRTIGRSRDIPNFSSNQYTEVWVEMALRYSPTFTACSAWQTPCDHKTAFLLVLPDENGRWAVHMNGNGGTSWSSGRSYGVKIKAPKGFVNNGSPAGTSWNTEDGGIAPGKFFWYTPGQDSTWHVWRWYVKHSASQTNDSTTNSMDARIALWQDDVLIYDSKAWVETSQSPEFGTFNFKGGSGGTYVRALIIAINKDKGAGDAPSDSFPRTESMYIGRAALWVNDPGWVKWPSDTPSIGTF